MPTVKDILEALARPGRDPREDLPPPVFKKGILKLEDLQPGMELKGTVLNVVDFGAFVDIGLKDTGLVHISQMANRYVKSPYDVVSVGDIVTVWVIAVDPQDHRVSLTMIRPGTERKPQERGRGRAQGPPQQRREGRREGGGAAAWPPAGRPAARSGAGAGRPQPAGRPRRRVKPRPTTAAGPPPRQHGRGGPHGGRGRGGPPPPAPAAAAQAVAGRCPSRSCRRTSSREPPACAPSASWPPSSKPEETGRAADRGAGTAAPPAADQAAGRRGNAAASTAEPASGPQRRGLSP